jgi:hypothetical protein
MQTVCAVFSQNVKETGYYLYTDDQMFLLLLQPVNFSPIFFFIILVPKFEVVPWFI